MKPTHLTLKEVFGIVSQLRPTHTVAMTDAGVYLKEGDRWTAIACVMVGGVIAITAGTVPAIGNDAFERLVKERREVCA